MGTTRNKSVRLTFQRQDVRKDREHLQQSQGEQKGSAEPSRTQGLTGGGGAVAAHFPLVQTPTTDAKKNDAQRSSLFRRHLGNSVVITLTK